MRTAAAIFLTVALVASGCGDEAARRVTEPFVPDEVALTTDKDSLSVALGGTLVGGRLFYGRTREQGREAASRDIARGRPQWIGCGNVAWHHSGVSPDNGLPGVRWSGWGPGEFVAGYNGEIETALKQGAIRPPAQVNERSNYFVLNNLLAQGAVWPELKSGRTPLGPEDGPTLLFDAHPKDADFGYASIDAGTESKPIRFALVTLPVRLYLPDGGQEIVLQEKQTIRVFHRKTGTLLRQFPHSQRAVDETRKLQEERAKKEGASK